MLWGFLVAQAMKGTRAQPHCPHGWWSVVQWQGGFLVVICGHLPLVLPCGHLPLSPPSKLYLISLCPRFLAVPCYERDEPYLLQQDWLTLLSGSLVPSLIVLST